jgi:hypothetical protein
MDRLQLGRLARHLEIQQKCGLRRIAKNSFVWLVDLRWARSS